MKESASNLQVSLQQLETTINNNEVTQNENVAQTPKAQPRNDPDKVQTVVTPNKWPLKPGVLVHINSNHTLSPKNQARLNKSQNNESNNEERNLGVLERNRHVGEPKISPRIEYSKKNGKPRKQKSVTGIFKNLRRKSDSSDDSSGKYKKINKSNERAVSLVTMSKSYGPRKRLRSFFQSETPNVIVTEGGSYLF